MKHATNATSSTEAPIDQEGDFTDFLGGVGGNDLYVKVYRITRDGAEFCGQYDAEAFSEERVQQEWGGGHYQASVYERGKRGRRGGRNFRLAGLPKESDAPPPLRLTASPPPAAAPSPPAADMTMIGVILQQQQAFTSMLMQQQQAAATAQAEVFKAMMGRQQQTPGVSELGELFKLLQSMRTEEATAPSELTQMVTALGQVAAVTAAAKKRAPQRATARRVEAARPVIDATEALAASTPLAALPSSVPPSIPAPPPPPPTDTDPFAPLARMLAQSAAKNRDPETWADIIADTLGDETITTYIDATQSPGLTDGIIEAYPECGTSRDFLIEVEAALRAMYQESEESVDSEAENADNGSKALDQS